MQFFPISLRHGGALSTLVRTGASAKSGSLFFQLLGHNKGASSASLWERILALREKGGIDDDLWQRLTDWKKSGEDGRLAVWLAQVCPELLPGGWTFPLEVVPEDPGGDSGGEAAQVPPKGSTSLWAAHGAGKNGPEALQSMRIVPEGDARAKEGLRAKSPTDFSGAAPARSSSGDNVRCEVARTVGLDKTTAPVSKHGQASWEEVSGRDASGKLGAAVEAFAATEQRVGKGASGVSEAARDAQSAAHGGVQGKGHDLSASDAAQSLWKVTTKKVFERAALQDLAGDLGGRRDSALEEKPLAERRGDGRLRGVETVLLEDSQELGPRAVRLHRGGWGTKDGKSEQQLQDERREMLWAAQRGQGAGMEGAAATAFSSAGHIPSRTESLAPSIVEQTAQIMVRQLSPGIKQLTIQIEPQDLGPIHVALQVRGGEVHAVLRPVHHETGQILNAHLATLRHELERQGFQVARLDVQAGLADMGSHNAWDGASQHQRQSASDDSGNGFLWRRGAMPEESLARNLQEGQTPGLHTALLADGAVDLFA